MGTRGGERTITFLRVTTVSKRMGHSRTSITLNTYAHVLEEGDKASSDMIAEIIYHSENRE